MPVSIFSLSNTLSVASYSFSPSLSPCVPESWAETGGPCQEVGWLVPQVTLHSRVFCLVFFSQRKVLPTVIWHVYGRTDRRCFSQSNKVSKYTAGHLQFNPVLYIHSKISLLLLPTSKKKNREYGGGLFSNCLFLIFSVLDVNCGRIFTPNCQILGTWQQTWLTNHIAPFIAAGNLGHAFITSRIDCFRLLEMWVLVPLLPHRAVSIHSYYLKF